MQLGPPAARACTQPLQVMFLLFAFGVSSASPESDSAADALQAAQNVNDVILTSGLDGTAARIIVS